MRHVLGLDQPLLDRELPADLLQEVQGVVHDHAADHEDDDQDVDAGDQVEDGTAAVAAPGGFRAHVDLADGKTGLGAGVALAAGLDEVGLVDGRGWVVLGFDRVRTVAAGAVHDLDRAPAVREPVVTVLEGLERVRGQPVFPGQPQRGVARGADLLGYVARVHGGRDVLVAADVVLAVAVGAGGGVGVALAQGAGVDAAVERRGDLGVALRAGFRDVQLVGPRGPDHRPVHLVRPVAIDTVRRLDFAGLKCGPMHTQVE